MSPKRRSTDLHDAERPVPATLSGDRLTPRQERTAPDRRIVCPRHMWPTVWRTLQEARATFATGHARDELITSGAVELLVTRAGASRLRPLGLKDEGSACNPWPAARLEANGRDWRALDDRPGDDALDRAFRAAEKAAKARRQAPQPDEPETATEAQP